MKKLLAFVFAALLPMPAVALPHFNHVIVVIQENRTPDNFFYGLCTRPGNVCAVPAKPGQYDLLTTGWRDKIAPGGTRNPAITPLGINYDVEHNWPNFNRMCDMNTSGICQNDQTSACAAGTCPADPSYAAVVDTHMIPYYEMAELYGFSNQTYQTNEGSSWPGHQLIFGSTSAVSQAQDAAGNMIADSGPGGCASTTQQGVVGPHRTYIGTAKPCLEHTTLSNLLSGAGLTWTYYGVTDPYWPDPNPAGLWIAPNSISHICGTIVSGQCTGPNFTAHVKFTPSQVITDIDNCNLSNMVWVTPMGEASDHANGGAYSTLGPAWVASIINAVGNSKCQDAGSSTYWNDTAIIVTWDDWGGWWDHETPTISPSPFGGTERGYRVPLLVVSAYTRKHMIRNEQEDFSSITRFAEQNFGIPEGNLGLADARYTGDLHQFFPLTNPRVFAPIVVAPGTMQAADFIRMDKDPNHKPVAPDLD